MKSISTFAIAAALVVGGAIVTAPIHEAAAAKPKKKQKGAAAAPAAPVLNITKEARPALLALEAAVKAKDAAAYAAALPAAEAAATTADEKFFVSLQRYQHARGANDGPGQVAALEALVASGGGLPAQVAAAHATLALAAYNASEWQKAHDNFAKVVELRPDDTDARFNLALTKRKLKRDAEAFTMIEQMIATAKAANKPVPETWYRTALDLAFIGRKPQALALGREVLAAYPTTENWRNLLVVYRDTLRNDEAGAIDVLRLMRASKSMTGKNEYYDLAYFLVDAQLPGEAKAVIDEALAARLAQTSDESYRRVNNFVTGKIAEDRASLTGLETRAMAAATGRLAFRTADALLGYGEYRRAAALYRAALAKGGDVDAGLTNTHLGIALALAGDKPGAEAAFKAVTGQRADVAALWLAWLSRNP